MKRFYERYYQADQKLLQAVAVLPWGHNACIEEAQLVTFAVLQKRGGRASMTV